MCCDQFLYYYCYLNTVFTAYIFLFQRRYFLRFPGDPDYWNSPHPNSQTNPVWMKSLSNSRYFTDISTPGTHDTMARKGGPAAWTQSLSLTVQLELGIRFFDIRCRAYGKDMPIHHGIFYQHKNFYDVLNGMTNFLNSRSSEIIFMRVKQEYSHVRDSVFYGLVKTHIDRYPAKRFWLQDHIGKIGEARGKIVLLRDFTIIQNSPFGIPYRSLDIADDFYQASYSKKFNGVKAHIEKARASLKNKMFLT